MKSKRGKTVLLSVIGALVVGGATFLWVAKPGMSQQAAKPSMEGCSMMQGADAGQNPTADKQGQPLTEAQWKEKVEKRIQECEKILAECKKMLEEHKAQVAKNAPTPAT